MISLPHINQVYVMFRSRLADLAFGPGTESLEVALFDEEEIPWDQLAFRTIGRTLRCYFLDRKLGSFPVHVSTIDRRVPVSPTSPAPPDTEWHQGRRFALNCRHPQAWPRTEARYLESI